MNKWLLKHVRARLTGAKNSWANEGVSFLPSHVYVRNDESNKTIVDNVLRFENLKVEFAKLMKKYNMNVTLPSTSVNAGRGRGEAGRLTQFDLCPETIRAINEYMRGDFEMFGYEMRQANASTCDYDRQSLQSRPPTSS